MELVPASIRFTWLDHAFIHSRYQRDYPLYTMNCTSVLAPPPWPSSRHFLSNIRADEVMIWHLFPHLPFRVALHNIGVTTAIGGYDLDAAVHP